MAGQHVNPEADAEGWRSAAAPWSDDTASDYVTVAGEAGCDTPEARRLYDQARREMQKHLEGKECDLAKAQKLLEQALAADVRFGPAHHSLGVLYFWQHKLYLAAWEFEYAARLMPDRFEPLNDLGLVYESARKFDQAKMYYALARGRKRDIYFPMSRIPLFPPASSRVFAGAGQTETTAPWATLFFGPGIDPLIDRLPGDLPPGFAAKIELRAAGDLIGSPIALEALTNVLADDRVIHLPHAMVDHGVRRFAAGPPRQYSRVDPSCGSAPDRWLTGPS